MLLKEKRYYIGNEFAIVIILRKLTNIDLLFTSSPKLN